MSDIKIREEKMKERAKSFSFRDFVKAICSREPMNFYKYSEGVTVYPDTPRRGNLVPPSKYEDMRDDLMKYGRDYDFNKSRRENFSQLYNDIPKIAIRAFPPFENSDYADGVRRGIKNAYLAIGLGLDCENILYTFEVKEGCRNILNSTMARTNCQNVYQSAAVINSYNIFYSKLIYNCSDVRFSSNLTGCHECLLCHDLQNKSYCIENKEYDKDEYATKKEELLRQKDRFMEYFNNLKTDESMILSKNTTGHFCIQSENTKDGLYIYRMRNSQNVVLLGSENGNNENVNCITSGAPNFDFIYNVLNSGGGDYVFSSDYLGTCSHVYYTYFIEYCSFCLGCIGIKNKQFCILNKEYPKEQRYELAGKIFAQMESQGVLGDFFPGWMNPYYFNDTAACLIDDSFTKEEVTKQGYLRRDEEIKVDIPQNADVVEAKNLAPRQGFENGKRQINPEILKKVIKDEKGNYYRIVKMEYDFLMKYGLPLPELHRLERIKLGFKFK